MKFAVLIYTDPALMDALPTGQADSMMRDCFAHADELRGGGRLLDSLQLDDPPSARSIRIRQGKMRATDGPFAETKEVLGGFNIIEAENMDEAVRIAAEFPWARTGCVEVRPVRDMDMVRERVGAAPFAERSA